MNRKKRHLLEYLSTAGKWFSSGIVIGASIVVVWGLKAGFLEEDIQLRLGFMLGIPLVIFLGAIPGLCLQFFSGIARIKESSHGGTE